MILKVHNEFEKGLKMGHFINFFIFITSTEVNLLQQTLPRLSPGEFNKRQETSSNFMRCHAT